MSEKLRLARTKSSLRLTDVHHPDGPESSLTHRRKGRERENKGKKNEDVLLVRREVDIETEKYTGTERMRQHVTEEMHLSHVTCRAALFCIVPEDFYLRFSIYVYIYIYIYIYIYNFFIFTLLMKAIISVFHKINFIF